MFLHVDYFSRVLGKTMQMDVCLPQTTGNAPCDPMPEQGWKVLYLIHGWSDNHTCWQRFTSIERYAASRGVVVVMPDADLSFYTDMAHGAPYYTHMTEELPALVKEMFHVSDRREDTFICGLSMGGYGTLRMAMLNPEKYAAAACLSAGNFAEMLAVQAKGNTNQSWLNSMNNIFGDKFPDIMGTEYDVFHIVEEQLAAGKTMPRLFHCIGTEDNGYAGTQSTRAFFEARREQFDYTYREYPGAHNWEFWDAHICEAMDFFGLTEAELHFPPRK